MLYLLIIFTFLFVLCFVRINSQGNWQMHDFSLAETLPLRGILAVCVMLCHLCPYLDDYAPLLSDFCNWGPPSVATFFLLTGYGLAYSVKTKGRKYLDGFFKKRLLRLIWPLLIMTVIYQTYRYCQGSFTLMSMLEEPSPMSWFIYALIIWYIGFYASFKWAKTTKAALYNIWIFTFIYLVVTIKLGMGYYYISILPLPLAITYVQYEEFAKEYIKIHTTKVLSLVSIITLAVLLYATLGQYGMRLPAWGPPVYTVVPFAIMMVIYLLGGGKNKYLNFLGSISYEFYIVHGFIVMQIGPLGDFGKGQIGCYLNVSLVLSLSVVCGWMMKTVCGKIMTKE